jgi:hypothetical protein
MDAAIGGATAVGVGLAVEGAARLVGRVGGEVVEEAAEIGSRATREPAPLARGKRAHSEEPVRPTEKSEVTTPSGKRMDRYDATNKHIREIKPDNPRQIKRGKKQVEQYRREMEEATGEPHTGEVSTYDPKKYEDPDKE